MLVLPPGGCDGVRCAGDTVWTFLKGGSDSVFFSHGGNRVVDLPGSGLTSAFSRFFALYLLQSFVAFVRRVESDGGVGDSLSETEREGKRDV